MQAMEIVKPDGSKTPDGEKAMSILEAMLKNGLLGYMAGLHGQVVRLIPPLIITEEQVKKALDILEASIEEV